MKQECGTCFGVGLYYFAALFSSLHCIFLKIKTLIISGISPGLLPIYQVIYMRRSKKRKRVKTYTGEIIGFVWLVYVICITLFVFILIYLKAFSGINPAVLIMYGMPTFLSGVILKFKPLRIGAISCWVLSIFAALVEYEFQLLLVALAVFLAWIIPGYLLKSKFKKENYNGR